MSFLSNLFHSVLFQPLFNILIVFYLFIPGNDFGIAIIALTLLVKIILYPLGAKAVKTQRDFSRIQPLLKEIQEKYKDDKETQSKEIMNLYKKEKVNPFSPLLTLIIQLPILWALYWVVQQGLQAPQASILYSFIPAPSEINPFFLKIIDLSKPNWIFAVVAAALQFWQVKTAVVKQKADKNNKSKKTDISKMMEKQMQYFTPAFTLLILFNFPSAIGLYWIVNTLFTIGQQYLIFKKPKTELLTPELTPKS